LLGNRDRKEKSFCGESEVILLFVASAIKSRILNVLLERKHRAVLEFLSTADHTINHKVAQKLQQVGTGKWFLDGKVFQGWLNSEKSFLWVYGIGICKI